MKKVTMVEHIDDYGNWNWYCLYDGKITEKEAIKAYCKEMDLPCGRIREEDCYFYSQLTNVRALKVRVFKSLLTK